MTPDQIITLLRIWRGSFNGKPRHKGDDQILNGLVGWGLIEQPDDDGAYYVTTKGNTYIEKLRSVSP